MSGCGIAGHRPVIGDYQAAGADEPVGPTRVAATALVLGEHEISDLQLGARVVVAALLRVRGEVDARGARHSSSRG